MKSIANALLYNVAWFIGVWFAAKGQIWWGPAAMLSLVALHLSWVKRAARPVELRFLLAVAVVGSIADSGLHLLGAIDYPTSQEAWGLPFVPPWIIALWLGFGTMPRFSLGWLRRFSWPLAAAFGAVGGPLAFYGGQRLGAIAPGWGWQTYAVLAIEYGALTVLMVFGWARMTAKVSYESVWRKESRRVCDTP